MSGIKSVVVKQKHPKRKDKKKNLTSLVLFEERSKLLSLLRRDQEGKKQKPETNRRFLLLSFLWKDQQGFVSVVRRKKQTPFVCFLLGESDDPSLTLLQSVQKQGLFFSFVESFVRSTSYVIAFKIIKLPTVLP